VRTDKILPNYKPGIIIRDNKQGTYMLMDVAIPRERGMVKKRDEKF